MVSMISLLDNIIKRKLSQVSTHPDLILDVANQHRGIIIYAAHSLYINIILVSAPVVKCSDISHTIIVNELWGQHSKGSVIS